MYGYYDQTDIPRRRVLKAALGAAAGLAVGGVLARRELGEAASRLGTLASENPRLRAALSGGARAAAEGLSRAQEALGSVGFLSGHFEPQSYVRRGDHDDFDDFVRRMPAAEYQRQAAQEIRAPLGSARPDGSPGWGDDKIDALLRQQGAFKALLQDDYDTADIRRLISSGGSLKKHLSREARSSGRSEEDLLDEAVRDLDAARRRMPARPRAADGEPDGAVVQAVRGLYRDRLRREAESGGVLGGLTGVRRARVTGDEADALRGKTGGDFDYGTLASSSANARYKVGDKDYDFSALRSMFLSAKDTLSDRVQIPLSPFQTGISLGQLFPFIARLGDRPLSGVYSAGFERGQRMEAFFGDKLISFDHAADTASVSSDSFTFMRTNKGYLRRMSEAQAAASEESPGLASWARGLSGGLGDVEDGTTPYWDKAFAFFRKFHAKDYLPNVLARAAKSGLETEKDALALSGVMREAGLKATDEDLASLLDMAQSATVRSNGRDSPLVHDLTDRDLDEGRRQALPEGLGLLTSRLRADGDSLGVWAASSQDLSEMARKYRGFSPRVRRQIEDMSRLAQGDRVRYLNRTASYEDSRRAETLFGLDVGAGAERVTNLHILRADLMSDVMSEMRGSSAGGQPVTYERIAGHLLSSGRADAALMAESLEFDRYIAADGQHAVGAINAYLRGDDKQGLRDYLAREGRQRFNLLHTHPRTPGEKQDFAERARVVAMRKNGVTGFLPTAARPVPAAVGRAWRAFTSTSSLADGDATPGSMFAYFLTDRLHTAFAEVGLGLKPQSRATPAALAAGLILGRYLPIFLGLPEAHKLANRVTRDVKPLNLLNPDLHRANVLDALSSATHRGGLRHKALALIPGLDFYTDDRGRSEERRSQRGAGYTPVRRGRWWAFGSREAFFGDHVSYYLPSAARFARSDWQAASNVKRNDAEYWKHFGGYLNPTNWGKGAYWWEKCILPGMLLHTSDNKVKRADEITVGDRLVSHTGKLQTVTHVFPKSVDEIVYSISAYGMGIQALETTQDHKILAWQPHACPRRKTPRPGRKPVVCVPDATNHCANCGCFVEPSINWVEARHLSATDYLITPLPQMPSARQSLDTAGFLPSTRRLGSLIELARPGPQKGIPAFIPLDADFYRLLGYTLAEGHVGKRHITWTFHLDEVDYAEDVAKLIQRIFGQETNLRVEEQFRRRSITWRNSAGALLFRALTYAEKAKALCPDLLTNNDECLIGLLTGLFRGDAYWGSEKYNAITYTSVSPILVSQTYDILVYLGYNPTFDKHKKSADKRGWTLKPEYDISLFGEDATHFRAVSKENPVQDLTGRTRHTFRHGSYLYRRIRTIDTRHYTGQVYDFTVEHDHSFSVLGYCVHNCQARSRPYLMSGEAFDPDHPWSAPLNATIGRFLKPRKVYHPEYLPKRMGGTLEDMGAGERPTSPFFGRLSNAGSERIRNRGEGSSGLSKNTLRPGAEGGQGVPARSAARGSATGDLPSGYVMRIPRARKLRDASNDPLLERLNLARFLRRQPKLTPKDKISPEEKAYVRTIDLDDGFSRSLYHLQEIAGLYGWFGSLIAPGIGHPVGKTEVASASRGYGRERRFYDQEIGGLGGNISDVLRRFLPHRRRSAGLYDPAPNDMPDWLPGRDYMVDFRHGDPYARIEQGEARLPGSAYSRLHPGTAARMLRMRASSLGKSQQEMEDYLVRKEGEGDHFSGGAAAEMGTRMHRVLQERWRKLGLLEGDEVEVFDPKLNVTGHIDAILRVPDGRGSYARTIVDIKTKTQEKFDAVKRSGRPEDENLDQILFYMHTTGIKRGLLTYVSRDNVDDVFQVQVKFDKKRFAQAVGRLQAARASVLQRVKEGAVKEGDLYDPITKIEILGDVAPYSDQYKRMQEWATRNKSSLSKEDQGRLEDLAARVHRQKQGFEIHPLRFTPVKTRTERVQVHKFVGRDAFEATSGRVYKLAGLQKQEGSTTGAEEWWGKSAGLRVGSRVSVITEQGSEPPADRPNRATAAAVYVGGRNVARSMMRSGAARENRDDFSAAARLTRFTSGERLFGRVAEYIAHLDSPINTKFLPARTGLEQYTRTDVYGKRGGSWDSPISSYIWPTLTSFANKNPLAGAAMGAALGALFFPFKSLRVPAIEIGAVAGAALAFGGTVLRASGHPFIARAVKRRRALDTYYDTLTYVKYRRLAAMEERLARREEHADVDELDGSKAENVTKDQREYASGLRDTAAEIRKRQARLQARASRSRNPAAARLLRRKVAALQEEADDVASESAKATESGRYPIGPHAQQALLYRQRYRATVRGALEGSSWDAALSALPKPTRSAIIDVIQHGSRRDRTKLYALLPDDQKAVLGFALDIDEKKIPNQQSLLAYFKRHALPSEDWAGWRADASLDFLKARDIVRTKQDPGDFGIFPSTVDAATQGSPEASIALPTKAGRRGGDTAGLRAKIHSLLQGYGLSGVRVSVSEEEGAGGGHEADVSLDVSQRRETGLFNSFQSSGGFR